MTGIDKLLESPGIEREVAEVRLINAVATMLSGMREWAGLTQRELAKRMGVSQPRIAQLESGKPSNAPAVAHIADYAHFCGLEVGWHYVSAGAGSARVGLSVDALEELTDILARIEMAARHSDRTPMEELHAGTVLQADSAAGRLVAEVLAMPPLSVHAEEQRAHRFAS